MAGISYTSSIDITMLGLHAGAEIYLNLLFVFLIRWFNRKSNFGGSCIFQMYLLVRYARITHSLAEL